MPYYVDIYAYVNANDIVVCDAEVVPLQYMWLLCEYNRNTKEWSTMNMHDINNIVIFTGISLWSLQEIARSFRPDNT